MATAPVKSHPLHNFSLPFLKWGGKNQTNTNHRCRRSISGEAVAASDDHNSEPETRDHRVGSSTAKNQFGFSSCYLGDKSHEQHQPLQKVSINETENEAGERKRETEETKEARAEETVPKPWNLRPRKSIFSKSTVEIGIGASWSGELKETAPPAVTAFHSVHQTENPAEPKSLRLRGFAGMQSTRRKEKRKVWIALSKEDIEEDIFAMTGSRPSRRPKKRPKNVQKQLDSVFPGLWLVGVTADAYRVADTPVKR